MLERHGWWLVLPSMKALCVGLMISLDFMCDVVCCVILSVK